MLDKNTKDRISKDAEVHYRKSTLYTNDYIAGAEKEAERAAGLVEALEKIRKWDLSGLGHQVLAEEALIKYRNTSGC